jgi:hypothetical protein
MEDQRILTLMCNDGTKVDIDSVSSEKSGLLKRLMGDFSDNNILLNNDEVDGETCKAIVEYLIHYKDTPVENIKEIWKPLKTIVMKDVTHGDIWAADFIDKFQPLDLITLANASSFFELPTLSNLVCAKIATFFYKYQDDPAKLRETFNLDEDMTEEDIRKIKEEEEKMNPYELLIRDSIMIWHPYDEEHNKEPETK